MSLTVTTPVAKKSIATSKLSIALGLLLVVAMIMSWMIFPYMFEGRDILSQTGSDIKLSKIEKSRTASQFLSRRYMTETREELTATFATPEYFEFAEKIGGGGEMDTDKYLIFFITESLHKGSLPKTLPDVTLLLPDSTNIKPVKIDGPSNVEHHRVSFVYFDKFDANGELVVPEDGSPFRIVMQNTFEGAHDYVGWFEWTNPILLPEELKDASLFSPLSVIWLSIGLLSAVLTPCMLQLSMMYFAVLSGSTAWLSESQLNEQDKNKLIQKKMMSFALAFIVGFVVLFGVIGALIGWSGQLMQAYFAMYETQISVSSGIVVLAFGLYLAHQARMPMVCRMPMGKLSNLIQNNSLVSSSLLSIGYSLGCITCFGGAIIGTLMIYVGTLESPLLGASIMGLFAIGVGVPFLLAAIMMSRVQGILDIMMRFQRPIQLFTAVVVIFFGTVLVTDNYHTISDFLAPYMGL